MKWPRFNDHGDLPPGLYGATLAQVLEHFGQATLRRRMMAQRLERIYRLAVGTGHLARFIVFGSFVTAKPDPGDVDVFMVMDDTFDLHRLSREEGVVFEHMFAHNYEGASVFWIRRSSILDSEQETVEHWQYKRDKTKRGIVEVTSP